MAKKEIDKKALNAEISKVMMSDFERIGQGIVDYWKPLSVTVIGIAVLVSVICYAAAHQKKSTRLAQEALSEASNVAELSSVLDTYGDSSAAPTARYRLATLYIAEKKYDEALKTLELAAGSKNVHLNGSVALLEAYVLEKTGKLADAAAKFEAIDNNAEFSSVMRAEARFAAARLYVKQNRIEQALVLLKQVPSNAATPDASSSWNELSLSLLRAIESGEYGAYSAETKAI
ncbi:MAG: tetratricopeptide repeat protein [Victivallales bacterium]|jgi:tetratricopeptide (TPR) repeat protein|nr:tetratricopeptide repeat protein [Victivallales bacterium]